MKRIAVILTCFNRKEKTLSCLSRFYNSGYSRFFSADVYLTDDNSSDGTAEEVLEKFPSVVISHGNGFLFWAGGMNLSWNRAIEQGGYDGYLWLNDDTELLSVVWPELLAAEEYSKSTFGMSGIYVGTTRDRITKRLTYGGWRYSNKFLGKIVLVPPNGSFQICEIGNGNITFVSADVASKLGCFYPGYVHGADFDYTYWAHTQGFPVLLLREVVGLCDDDHVSHKENLLKRGLKDRIKYLYSPVGLQLKTAILFQKRFFPYRVPYVYLSYWFKAIFPQVMK